jgi:hypothetical protein
MGIPLFQENSIFLLIAKVVDLQILCRESPEVESYHCAFGLEIQSCPTEKSHFIFSRKIVASSWWWHRWDRKSPFLECHHQYLTTKKKLGSIEHPYEYLWAKIGFGEAQNGLLWTSPLGSRNVQKIHSQRQWARH